MEKPILCIVSLVVGSGLGFMLAKSTIDREEAKPEQGGVTTGVNGSSLTGGSTAAGSSSRSKRGGVGGGSRNIDVLLNLVDTNYLASNRELYETVDRLDLAGIEALAKEMEDVPVSDNRLYKVRAALYTRWAQLDRDAAWQAATRIHIIHIKGQAMNAIVAEIARTDLSAARQLVEGLKNGPVKQAAMNGFIASGSQQNPELVFEMANKLFGNQASRQFDQLFRQWGRDDPEAAIARISEIQGQQNRSRALNGLMNGLAEMDPDRAISFTMGLENMAERRRALSAVAANITATDPQRALGLLEQVPSGDQRRQMIGSIASTWANQDPDAAREWMQWV
ncbi:MAG: hypothetical protein ACI9R3_005737 [Verrucomicrobiales bacterium]|jgi:hypothetical protein